MDPAEAERFRGLIKDLQQSLAANNAEQLEAAAVGMLEFMAQRQEQASPTAESRLEEEIEAAEKRHAWEESLALRRELIALALGKGNTLTMFVRYIRMSRLLMLLGRAEEARQAAETAMDWGRREEMESAVAYSAISAALYTLAAGREERALELARQARVIYDSLSETITIGSLEIPLANCRLVLGRCLAATGDLAGAEEELQAAWRQFEQLADSDLLVGIQGSIAACWEVRALLHQARGETSSALEALEKAILQRQRVLGILSAEDHEPHIGAYHLARTLRKYQDMLETAGRTADASEVDRLIEQICQSIKVPRPGLLP